MFQIVKTFGTALAAILSDRLISAVNGLLTGAESLSPTEQMSLNRTINSQAIAAAVFARFGVSGLASAYDAGIISVADFAAYVVKSESYRISPANVGRIKDLEEKAKDSGIFNSAFTDLAEVTTDPDSVARMYGYLLAQQSFR